MAIVPGTSDGTSSRLTVDSAATALEGLLSDDLEIVENTGTREPQPPTGEDESVDTESEEETASSEESEESEGEEQEDEEDDEEEQTPAPRKLRVKVDGQELEVTEDEAIAGYSRTQDYTRKTQALAEQRKLVEQEQSAARVERQQYATALQQLQGVLEANAPEEVDWAGLRAEDPTEFAVRWAEQQQHQARMQRVAAEQQRVFAQLEADQQKDLQRHLATEREKLIAAVPAWKDTAVAKTEKAEMAKFAAELGYTEKDLTSVTDHRVMVLLRDAMLYRKSQAQRPKLKEKIEKVRVATPGTPAKKTAVTELTRKKQRLAKTGRVEDAASIMEMFIDD